MRLFAPKTASTTSVAEKILPLRHRAEVRNKWLMERLTTVLPEVMVREGFDMWIVMAREYNEDPVIMTLLPDPAMYARRRTILLFCARDDGTVERLTLSRYGMGQFYQASWDPEKEGQWDCVARVVRERDPKCIGINVSNTFAFGDGLSHGEYHLLSAALGTEYMARTRSAERLCVGWLERRTETELSAYSGIVDIAHSIVGEAFSSSVIYPGVTTTEDVVWWMRQKMLNLGLETWFQPSIDIQSAEQGPPGPGGTNRGERSVIMPGDVLHCDIGIKYLGLCTDTQHNAYVLKSGETDAPAGLKEALRTGNRFQDIVTAEYKTGRTGNQILLASLAQANAEGIVASLYTHPLGFHGHAAGPTIGLWDSQGGVKGNGDYELFENTCYALELNIRRPIPEWGGREVRIALEEDIVHTKDGVRYLGERQTEFYLIQ